jgi:hypothetical protein
LSPMVTVNIREDSPEPPSAATPARSVAGAARRDGEGRPAGEARTDVTESKMNEGQFTP